MIKKINIFLVLLLLLISVGAVSAAEEGNMTDILSSEASLDNVAAVSADENIDYAADVLTVDDSSSKLSAKSYTVTSSKYNTYFNSDGSLIDSKVNSGDTIKLSGSFSDVSFVFNKTVKIVGVSNDMKNSMITLLSGASGSSISNLKITNTNDGTYGIFLNSASNCVIKNCTIKNTGKSSYCICLGNGANENTVNANNLETYGVTYGHNQRSTPPLVLSGSHHNTILKNTIKVDDANGIYLSSYSGGPLKGGESNYNTIKQNTINYNVLPTSWAFGIQVMGSNNKIISNKINGAYRGISTAGFSNEITSNTINHLTGADYNNPNVEIGGDYGIVGSYNTIISNNKIINSKIIADGAGISAIDNSIVENNKVQVTEKGRGIVAGGSNVIIRNNVITTQSGSGIYEKDEGSGLLVDGNNITSDSGVGILVEKLSSKRMPKNVTVVNNIISTNNKFAIDVAGVQAGTSDTDYSSNTIIGSGLINSPAGVIDNSKPTYTYKGTVHKINSTNFSKYINDNGGLTSEIKDGDTLEFEGTFSNKVIYVTKQVKITGNNPIFYNSTFKVTCGNVLIENLIINNNKAERVNAWGIFVNQAQGVRIQKNNISVSDPKASYAIYVLDSTNVEVLNNVLYSEGDYLTFTLLAYGCEDCKFENNVINTKGTGDVYNFKPEKCLDANEVCIDGKTYCVDGNELFINGVRYCLDGNTVCIDGKTYCVDGNEICIDGKTYCLDGNEINIDGKSVCIDGNEVFIDGNKFCLDGNEICIDGVTYCVDGNEICIDGVTYCLDGNEVCIDGKTYCVDGNNVCIDGVTYCVDGNNVCIDGKTYCFDGDEVCVDGKTYCFDGNNNQVSGAHVVSEIYQTYGILLLYSSNNVVNKNTVNVTSKLSKKQPTTGKGASTNSIVGIDLYFNCHNNTISQNNVSVSGKDNYIYGMGVLGYNTGHSAPEGQGATNNKFIGNELDLKGVYCVEGIIIGDESEDTLIENNVINIESGSACAYGIYFEMSQKSTAKNNTLTLNSQVIYGIEGYSSNDNIILNNTIEAVGKQVYGVLFANGKNNNISNNIINSRGSGKNVTVKILDSLSIGNAGIYLIANSTNNYIADNEVYSKKGFAVLLDDEAINNIIIDNYLHSQNGSGNKGVNNSNGNVIQDNYRYVLTAEYDEITVPYLGTAEFSLAFNINSNIGVVKFYDVDGIEFSESKLKRGIASAEYTFDESYVPAQYVFSAKLFKDNYKVSTYELIVTIVKSNIAVNLEPASIRQGSAGEITATVLDELGNPIKGVNVKFYRLNSVGRSTPIGSVTSNKNGVATLSYVVPTSLNYGNHAITAQVEKFGYYNAGSGVSTLEVSSDIVVTLKPVSICQGSVGKITATVLDELGNPIKGAKVNLYLNSVGTLIGSVTSNKNGVATFSYTVPTSLNVGNHAITAQVEKFGYYNAGSGVSTLEVTSDIVVTIEPVSISRGSTGKIVATVSEKLGNPIKGAKVDFYLNSAGKSTLIGSATSNKDGVATLSYTVPTSLNVGNHTITAQVKKFSYYNAGSGVSTLEVPQNVLGTVIVAATTFSRYSNDYWGVNERGTNFYGTLYDENGNPLSGKTVQIAINGAYYNVTTDDNGKIGLAINLAASNTYTYAMFFQGDEDYKASLVASSKLTVVKKPTSIIANNMAFKTSASTKTVTVALSTIKNPYDGKMYLRSGKTLTLNVNGKTYTAKTNDKGVANFNIQINKAGTYTATIRYDGDNVYNIYQPTSKNIVITISNYPSQNKALSGVGVGSAPPKLAADGALNIVGDYADYLAKQKISTSNIDSSKKDTKIIVDAEFTRLANDYWVVNERGAYFYAILKDSNDKPVVGRTVQIAINGAIYNETSDSQGRVGLQINLAAANTYTYAISFSGDDTYNPAALASTKLTVTKKPITITASDRTFSASATKTISVTLNTVKNPYDGKIYLRPGKPVTLKINGQSYTAKTNDKGVATFTIKLTSRGTYTASIDFAGDDTYSASSKKITVKIT